MKRNAFQSVLFALLLLPGAYAAEQIGTVTASGAFELAGTQVPPSAARSLPLMNGERIKTSLFAATAVLQDGSRIAVYENSAVKFEHVGADKVLCLEEGALRFKAAEGSRLVVLALSRRIEVQASSEGTVSTKNPKEVQVNVENGPPVVVIDGVRSNCGTPKTASSLTQQQAIVIVSVGTAVATGLGLAVLGGEKSSELPERSPASP